MPDNGEDWQRWLTPKQQGVVDRLNGMSVTMKIAWLAVQQDGICEQVSAIPDKLQSAETALIPAAGKVHEETAAMIEVALKKVMNGSFTITKAQQAQWVAIGVTMATIIGAVLRSAGYLP